MRALASSVMDGEQGFVTIDSGYQDQDQIEAEEGKDKEEAMEEGGVEVEGGGVDEEGEERAVELPLSLRHGIYICPPAKVEDGLRRCVFLGSWGWWWVDWFGSLDHTNIYVDVTNQPTIIHDMTGSSTQSRPPSA